MTMLAASCAPHGELKRAIASGTESMHSAVRLTHMQFKRERERHW